MNAKDLIEIVERIKFLSEDVTEQGWLEPATVRQIHRLCEDAIIEWKCENAKIGEKMKPDEIKMFLDGWTDYNNEPLLFLKKLQQLDLSDEQIAGMLKVLDETCNYCWDNDIPCYCMRDD